MDGRLVKKMFSLLQGRENEWKDIETHLDQMLSNLPEALGKEDIENSIKTLSLEEQKSSCCKYFLNNCKSSNVLLSVIKIANKLSTKLKEVKENHKRKEKVCRKLCKKEEESKIQMKKNTLLVKKEYSKLADIPDDVTKTVCNFLPLEESFFWKYGTLSKKMLFPVVNLMSENKLLVRFDKDDTKYRNELRLLKSSPYIANAVEKLGVAILHRKNIKKEDIHRLSKWCKNLRVLDLYKTNVTLPMIQTVSMNCRYITHLRLGQCVNINKEMIEFVSNNFKSLEELSLPCCLTLKWRTAPIAKSRRDKKINVTSLFGVDIESYRLVHETNQCNINRTHSYKIGTHIGRKEVDGVLLSSFNAGLFECLSCCFQGV